MKRQNQEVLLQPVTETENYNEESSLLDKENMDIAVYNDLEIENPSTSLYKSNSVGCQIDIKKKKRSARVQTCSKSVDKACQTPKIKMKSIGVQCSFVTSSSKETIQISNEAVDNVTSTDECDENLSSDSDDSESSDFDLSQAVDDSDTDSLTSEEDRNKTEPRTFMVYEDQLLSLFEKCPICSGPAASRIKRTFGSLVQVEIECGSCHYHHVWDSQPMIGGIPAGNLMISCGILFSGSLPSKCLRFMSMIGMESICKSTFFNHQKHFLQPTILNYWNHQKETYISETKNKAVCLAGDGRADTPGHSAKFGSYTLMDLDRSMVVEMQLVQSNEVKSSCHMEKEGLIRSINSFNATDIKIKTLVTDRHLQVAKWVRENLTDTKHCIDVWHVAKGLKKKLTALSKEKGCEEIQPWIKSISNHLYWVAASTPSADGKLMMEKWQSVQNHIQNIHEGHGELFPKCCHDELIGRERKKLWLRAGTKACEKLQDIVTSRQIRKDVPMLSTGQQTSCLESYHSVVNHFAPKMIGFSYHGQLCRLILAALHFNENSKREHLTEKNGGYSIFFPKFKKGDYSLRKVMAKPTYEYTEKLKTMVIAAANLLPSGATSNILPIAPPPLCSNYTRPDKEKSVLEIHSRFNK